MYELLTFAAPVQLGGEPIETGLPHPLPEPCVKKQVLLSVPRSSVHLPTQSTKGVGGGGQGNNINWSVVQNPCLANVPRLTQL